MVDPVPSTNDLIFIPFVRDTSIILEIFERSEFLCASRASEEIHWKEIKEIVQSMTSIVITTMSSTRVNHFLVKFFIIKKGNDIKSLLILLINKTVRNSDDFFKNHL